MEELVLDNLEKANPASWKIVPGVRMEAMIKYFRRIKWLDAMEVIQEVTFELLVPKDGMLQQLQNISITEEKLLDQPPIDLSMLLGIQGAKKQALTTTKAIMIVAIVTAGTAYVIRVVANGCLEANNAI